MNYEIIKELRDYYDKTQQEMAEALGVSKQYFSKVENGHTQLSKEKISIFVEINWKIRYNVPKLIFC